MYIATHVVQIEIAFEMNFLGIIAKVEPIGAFWITL